MSIGTFPQPEFVLSVTEDLCFTVTPAVIVISHAALVISRGSLDYVSKPVTVSLSAQFICCVTLGFIWV